MNALQQDMVKVRSYIDAAEDRKRVKQQLAEAHDALSIGSDRAFGSFWSGFHGIRGKVVDPGTSQVLFRC